MPIKVLAIDDDPAMTDLLALLLKTNKFETITANNGPTGIALVKNASPDIVLLDMMMPDMDGQQVCKEIRKFSNVPIIVLSALKNPGMVASALDAGADDYLTKPFSMEVLVARMEAILRRSHSDKSLPSLAEEIALGNYTYIPGKMRLSIGEMELKFTPKENELMKLLCENLGRPVSRSYALKLIWGDDTYFNARSMDVYMTKLRKMLKEDPRVQLLNLHGEGFRLSVEGL